MSESGSSSPLISVVVPVYMVEEYLRDCVDSILSQTYKNLEILLVDDGSPDRCGEICDEYAQIDNRVVSLHKKNGGLSDARNYGLKHARGKWISFIDSDDYVSPMFIEALFETSIAYGCAIASVPGGKNFLDGDACKLYERIQPDIPQASQKVFVNSDEYDESHPVSTEFMDARYYLEKILYQRLATGVQWRLYRRDVLGDDPFPVGLYYEDLASTYRFVHRAGSIAILGTRELYAYRIRSSSIIRQEYKHIKSYSALIVSKQLESEINVWYPDLYNAVASRCFSVCRMVYAQIPRFRSKDSEIESDCRSLWNTLKKYRYVVLCDSKARKRERLAAAIAALGQWPFSLFCLICRRIGILQ